MVGKEETFPLCVKIGIHFNREKQSPESRYYTHHREEFDLGSFYIYSHDPVDNPQLSPTNMTSSPNLCRLNSHGSSA